MSHPPSPPTSALSSSARGICPLAAWYPGFELLTCLMDSVGSRCYLLTQKIQVDWPLGIGRVLIGVNTEV